MRSASPRREGMGSEIRRARQRLAAKVGLLAHSNVGVAYQRRDKMDMSGKSTLNGPGRLFLDLLFPVESAPSARLGQIVLKVAHDSGKGASARRSRRVLPCRRAWRRRPGRSGLPGLRSAWPRGEGLVSRSGQRQDASRRRKWIADWALDLVDRCTLFPVPPRLHTPAAVERPLLPRR